MTTSRSVYEALVTSLETAYTGVNVRRGMPRFDDAAFVAPQVSVYVMRYVRSELKHVGKGTRRSMPVIVVLACASEPQLLDYIDTFWTWSDGAKVLGGANVSTREGGGRHVNETGTELEDYSFEFTVTLEW